MKIQAHGYEISYEGGRLADVLLDGRAIECVQVRDYDFERGEFGPEPTRQQVATRVKRFMRESGCLPDES